MKLPKEQMQWPKPHFFSQGKMKVTKGPTLVMRSLLVSGF